MYNNTISGALLNRDIDGITGIKRGKQKDIGHIDKKSAMGIIMRNRA